MSIRTDLALECVDFALEKQPEGVRHTEKKINGMVITTIDIENDEAGRHIGKPMGRYVTAETKGFQTASETFSEDIMALAEEISCFLPENTKTALIAGLGNSSITPDALGPEVVRYTLATRHINEEIAKEIGLAGLKSVSAIAPGVLGQTGIETAEIISALCEETKPDVVIAIDALASKSVSRLGCTIQISDTGISPGSGVLNRRKQLDRATLGVPVIAIGVPTIVDLHTIASDIGQNEIERMEGSENMMVTPREIDTLIEHAAKTVAYAVNKALQPSLSVEDIAALTA